MARQVSYPASISYIITISVSIATYLAADKTPNIDALPTDSLLMLSDLSH